MGLHRRVAHHQAAQDGHRGPDGAGQAQPRLLEHLKGQQHNEHLKHRGEGHLLFGGGDGQGQLYRDGLGVEGDQGDIQSRHQHSHQGAEPPDQIQGGGGHPVEGPVLPGLEELVNGARQQPGERQPVGHHSHPSLQQSLTEPVGPLGIGHHGEGGIQVVGEVLLNVARRLHPVDVDVPQAALHLLHGVRVGDAVQIDHIHLGAGLPPHNLLLDLQLGGLQVAADHGGVGADGLHKGLPHPFQGGLVGGLAHPTLLLRDHGEGQNLAFPGKKQHTAARHQVVGHLVQGVPHLGGQVVEGAVAQALEHLVHGYPAQGLVLGQGAEDVVA